VLEALSWRLEPSVFIRRLLALVDQHKIGLGIFGVRPVRERPIIPSWM